MYMQRTQKFNLDEFLLYNGANIIKIRCDLIMIIARFPGPYPQNDDDNDNPCLPPPRTNTGTQNDNDPSPRYISFKTIMIIPPPRNVSFKMIMIIPRPLLPGTYLSK